MGGAEVVRLTLQRSSRAMLESKVSHSCLYQPEIVVSEASLALVVKQQQVSRSW